MAFRVSDGRTGYWVGTLWIDVISEEDHDESSEVASDPVELGSDIADHIHFRPRVLTLTGVVTNTPTQLPQSHASGAQRSTEPVYIDGEPHGLNNAPGAPTGVLGVSIGQPLRLAGAIAPGQLPRRKLLVDTLRFDRQFDRVGEAKRALREAHLRGQTVELVLTGEALTNMVITSFRHTVSAANGGASALHFQLTCQQVRFAATERGDVPLPVEPRDKNASNGGSQPAVRLSDADADKAAGSKDSILYRLSHSEGG